MSRRFIILIAVLVVLVALAVAVPLGFGAYYAGHGVVPIHPGYGPGGGYWYGHPGIGFFPGFAVPIIIVVVFLLILSRRRRWGYWGPGGGRWGACGPEDPHATFDEWHRQAHAGQSPAPGTGSPAGQPAHTDGPSGTPAA